MSYIDRRQALKLVGLLGGAGLTAACSTFGRLNDNDQAGQTADQARARTQPVRIGLLVPRTGGRKATGDEMLNGFQLYLTRNGGRFGGHPVTLIIEDEGDTVQGGAAALTRLLNQSVLALTGVASSDVMLAVRDAVEKAQVPLVGSNASPASLQGVIYIWRTSYVNNEPGLALGGHLAGQVKGTVVLVAGPDTAGKDGIDGFKFAFGNEDPRIAAVTPAPDDSSFRDTIDQIQSIGPDAVFCTLSGPAGVQFVQQYRAAGVTAQLYAPGFLTEGSLPALGTSAENIYTAMNYSPDLDNQANREFTEAYRRAHGTVPTTYAMASYDAAAVLDKAVRLAGDTLNPQRINRMLANVGQVDSPRGIWQFNTPRTPQQEWYLRQVRRDGPLLGNVMLGQLATLG